MNFVEKLEIKKTFLQGEAVKRKLEFEKDFKILAVFITITNKKEPISVPFLYCII